jgi:tartrate dehydrogenase/decarboxylase/D-malate dehydrogenase
MKKTFQIALYPGDGIGPEVTGEAVRVLESVVRQSGNFALKFTSLPWGADYHAEHGRVMAADFLEVLRPFDAIILGAVGWPNKIPDHITLTPLIQIRQAFDQYACVRPARLYPGVRSPLRSDAPIDMVVVRENSEGEYIDNGGRFKAGRPEEFAVQTALHTRRGIERILKFSFELARTRRHKLTMITKSNAQKYGYVLWDEILEEMRGQYPDVTTDKQHIDAAALNFVRRPESFDVVVASNLFGDILTDLSAGIIGGMGLAPSANLNPERQFPSLFEPVHGSAPDIAGKGIANPIAAILGAAMMLAWLNEKEAATRIQQSVERTLKDGARTPDLGGSLSTSMMTDTIIANL